MHFSGNMSRVGIEWVWWKFRYNILLPWFTWLDFPLMFEWMCQTCHLNVTEDPWSETKFSKQNSAWKPFLWISVTYWFKLVAILRPGINPIKDAYIHTFKKCLSCIRAFTVLFGMNCSVLIAGGVGGEEELLYTCHRPFQLALKPV